jgi:ectoine hydroxylase-related dioxygenase (phytanoyl-CoA dioxygenase family)
MKYYNYDQSQYNFTNLFENLFNSKNLDMISEMHDVKYERFNIPGKDSETLYHKIFYDKMRSGWPEFISTYEKFIVKNIFPLLGNPRELIIQKWPSFRIHLPGNLAVAGFHRDCDYNHPEKEINFIVPVTKMYESNSTIIEQNIGKLDFEQMTAEPGQFIRFNGNKLLHGNLPNTTGKSRISFDFRVLRKKDYDASHNKTSLSKNNKFLIGHYYKVLKME